MFKAVWAACSLNTQRQGINMTKVLPPLISIGIPTYNRSESFLREALGSARSQTYPRIEIVVSDNCSPDDTEDYVSSLNDKRIRYIRQASPLTPNDNFNFCLKQARGKYFLLLHDDDVIDDDFVTTCMEKAGERPDVGVIRTGTRLIDSDGKIIRESRNLAKGKSAADLYHAWFTGKTSFYFSSTLFNTEKLREIGGFGSKHNLVQDCAAILELASRYERIEIEEPKACFREYANYIQYGIKVKLWTEDFLWLLDLFCKLDPERNAEMRAEGERFLAYLSYKRAGVVVSPVKRLIAYLTVWRLFGYRISPPIISRLFGRKNVTKPTDKV